MKFVLVLLFAYQCCYGYPTEGNLPASHDIENGTEVEAAFHLPGNETNSTLPGELQQGVFKKVVGKVKVGIKNIKNKIGGGNNGGGTGTGGGGNTGIGGGTNYRYRRPIRTTGGGGSPNPIALWIALGVVGGVIVVGVLGSIAWWYAMRPRNTG